jgi:hypothetical protein
MQSAEGYSPQPFPTHDTAVDDASYGLPEFPYHSHAPASKEIPPKPLHNSPPSPYSCSGKDNDNDDDFDVEPYMPNRHLHVSAFDYHVEDIQDIESMSSGRSEGVDATSIARSMNTTFDNSPIRKALFAETPPPLLRFVDSYEKEQGHLRDFHLHRSNPKNHPNYSIGEDDDDDEEDSDCPMAIVGWAKDDTNPLFAHLGQQDNVHQQHNLKVAEKLARDIRLENLKRVSQQDESNQITVRMSQTILELEGGHHLYHEAAPESEHWDEGKIKNHTSAEDLRSHRVESPEFEARFEEAFQSDEALEYALEQHEQELERQEKELRQQIEALQREEEERHEVSPPSPAHDEHVNVTPEEFSAFLSHAFAAVELEDDHIDSFVHVDDSWSDEESKQMSVDSIRSSTFCPSMPTVDTAVVQTKNPASDTLQSTPSELCFQLQRSQAASSRLEDAQVSIFASVDHCLDNDDESMAQRAQLTGLARVEMVENFMDAPWCDMQTNQGSLSASSKNGSNSQTSHEAPSAQNGGNGVHNFCQDNIVSEEGSVSGHDSPPDQSNHDDTAEENVELACNDDDTAEENVELACPVSPCTVSSDDMEDDESSSSMANDDALADNFSTCDMAEMQCSDRAISLEVAIGCDGETSDSGFDPVSATRSATSVTEIDVSEEICIADGAVDAIFTDGYASDATVPSNTVNASTMDESGTDAAVDFTLADGYATDAAVDAFSTDGVNTRCRSIDAVTVYSTRAVVGRTSPSIRTRDRSNDATVDSTAAVVGEASFTVGGDERGRRRDIRQQVRDEQKAKMQSIGQQPDLLSDPPTPFLQCDDALAAKNDENGVAAVFKAYMNRCGEEKLLTKVQRASSDVQAVPDPTSFASTLNPFWAERRVASKKYADTNATLQDDVRGKQCTSHSVDITKDVCAQASIKATHAALAATSSDSNPEATQGYIEVKTNAGTCSVSKLRNMFERGAVTDSTSRPKAAHSQSKIAASEDAALTVAKVDEQGKDKRDVNHRFSTKCRGTKQTNDVASSSMGIKIDVSRSGTVVSPFSTLKDACKRGKISAPKLAAGSIMVDEGGRAELSSRLIPTTEQLLNPCRPVSKVPLATSVLSDGLKETAKSAAQVLSSRIKVDAFPTGTDPSQYPDGWELPVVSSAGVPDDELGVAESDSDLSIGAWEKKTCTLEGSLESGTIDVEEVKGAPVDSPSCKSSVGAPSESDVTTAADEACEFRRGNLDPKFSDRGLGVSRSGKCFFRPEDDTPIFKDASFPLPSPVKDFNSTCQHKKPAVNSTIKYAHLLGSEELKRPRVGENVCECLHVKVTDWNAANKSRSPFRGEVAARGMSFSQDDPVVYGSNSEGEGDGDFTVCECASEITEVTSNRSTLIDTLRGVRILDKISNTEGIGQAHDGDVAASRNVRDIESNMTMSLPFDGFGACIVLGKIQESGELECVAEESEETEAVTDHQGITDEVVPSAVKCGGEDNPKSRDTGIAIASDPVHFISNCSIWPHISRAVPKEGSLALSKAIGREKILDVLPRQFDPEAQSDYETPDSAGSEGVGRRELTQSNWTAADSVKSNLETDDTVDRHEHEPTVTAAEQEHDWDQLLEEIFDEIVGPKNPVCGDNHNDSTVISEVASDDDVSTLARSHCTGVPTNIMLGADNNQTGDEVISGHNLITKLTSLRLDSSYQTGALSFVTSFEQTMDFYNDHQQENMRLSKLMMKALLQSAVSGNAALRALDDREQDHVAQGRAVFTYQEYLDALKTSAAIYDEDQKSGSSVNMMDLMEETNLRSGSRDVCAPAAGEFETAFETGARAPTVRETLPLNLVDETSPGDHPILTSCFPNEEVGRDSTPRDGSEIRKSGLLSFPDTVGFLEEERFEHNSRKPCSDSFDPDDTPVKVDSMEEEEEDEQTRKPDPNVPTDGGCIISKPYDQMCPRQVVTPEEEQQALMGPSSASDKFMSSATVDSNSSASSNLPGSDLQEANLAKRHSALKSPSIASPPLRQDQIATSPETTVSVVVAHTGVVLLKETIQMCNQTIGATIATPDDSGNIEKDLTSNRATTDLALTVIHINEPASGRVTPFDKEEDLDSLVDMWAQYPRCESEPVQEVLSHNDERGAKSPVATGGGGVEWCEANADASKPPIGREAVPLKSAEWLGARHKVGELPDARFECLRQIEVLLENTSNESKALSNDLCEDRRGMSIETSISTSDEEVATSRQLPGSSGPQRNASRFAFYVPETSRPWEASTCFHPGTIIVAPDADSRCCANISVASATDAAESDKCILANMPSEIAACRGQKKLSPAVDSKRSDLDGEGKAQLLVSSYDNVLDHTLPTRKLDEFELTLLSSDVPDKETSTDCASVVGTSVQILPICNAGATADTAEYKGTCLESATSPCKALVEVAEFPANRLEHESESIDATTTILANSTEQSCAIRSDDTSDGSTATGDGDNLSSSQSAVTGSCNSVRSFADNYVNDRSHVLGSDFNSFSFPQVEETMSTSIYPLSDLSFDCGPSNAMLSEEVEGPPVCITNDGHRGGKVPINIDVHMANTDSYCQPQPHIACTPQNTELDTLANSVSEDVVVDEMGAEKIKGQVESSDSNCDDRRPGQGAEFAPLCWFVSIGEGEHLEELQALVDNLVKVGERIAVLESILESVGGESGNELAADDATYLTVELATETGLTSQSFQSSDISSNIVEGLAEQTPQADDQEVQVVVSTSYLSDSVQAISQTVDKNAVDMDVERDCTAPGTLSEPKSSSLHAECVTDSCADLEPTAMTKIKSICPMGVVDLAYVAAVARAALKPRGQERERLLELGEGSGSGDVPDIGLDVEHQCRDQPSTCGNPAGQDTRPEKSTSPFNGTDTGPKIELPPSWNSTSRDLLATAEDQAGGDCVDFTRNIAETIGQSKEPTSRHEESELASTDSNLSDGGTQHAKIGQELSRFEQELVRLRSRLSSRRQVGGDCGIQRMATAEAKTLKTLREARLECDEEAHADTDRVRQLIKNAFRVKREGISNKWKSANAFRLPEDKSLSGHLESCSQLAFTTRPARLHANVLSERIESSSALQFPSEEALYPMGNEVSCDESIEVPAILSMNQCLAHVESCSTFPSGQGGASLPANEDALPKDVESSNVLSLDDMPALFPADEDVFGYFETTSALHSVIGRPYEDVKPNKEPAQPLEHVESIGNALPVAIRGAPLLNSVNVHSEQHFDEGPAMESDHEAASEYFDTVSSSLVDKGMAVLLTDDTVSDYFDTTSALLFGKGSSSLSTDGPYKHVGRSKRPAVFPMNECMDHVESSSTLPKYEPGDVFPSQMPTDHALSGQSFGKEQGISPTTDGGSDHGETISAFSFEKGTALFPTDDVVSKWSETSGALPIDAGPALLTTSDSSYQDFETNRELAVGEVAPGANKSYNIVTRNKPNEFSMSHTKDKSSVHVEAFRAPLSTSVQGDRQEPEASMFLATQKPISPKAVREQEPEVPMNLGGAPLLVGRRPFTAVVGNEIGQWENPIQANSNKNCSTSIIERVRALLSENAARKPAKTLLSDASTPENSDRLTASFATMQWHAAEASNRRRTITSKVSDPPASQIMSKPRERTTPDDHLPAAKPDATKSLTMQNLPDDHGVTLPKKTNLGPGPRRATGSKVPLKPGASSQRREVLVNAPTRLRTRIASHSDELLVQLLNKANLLAQISGAALPTWPLSVKSRLEEYEGLARDRPSHRFDSNQENQGATEYGSCGAKHHHHTSSNEIFSENEGPHDCDTSCQSNPCNPIHHQHPTDSARACPPTSANQDIPKKKNHFFDVTSDNPFLALKDEGDETEAASVCSTIRTEDTYIHTIQLTDTMSGNESMPPHSNPIRVQSKYTLRVDTDYGRGKYMWKPRDEILHDEQPITKDRDDAYSRVSNAEGSMETSSFGQDGQPEVSASRPLETILSVCDSDTSGSFLDKDHKETSSGLQASSVVAETVNTASLSQDQCRGVNSSAITLFAQESISPREESKLLETKAKPEATIARAGVVEAKKQPDPEGAMIDSGYPFMDFLNNSILEAYDSDGDFSDHFHKIAIPRRKTATTAEPMEAALAVIGNIVKESLSSWNLPEMIFPQSSSARSAASSKIDENQRTDMDLLAIECLLVSNGDDSPNEELDTSPEGQEGSACLRWDHDAVNESGLSALGIEIDSAIIVTSRGDNHVLNESVTQVSAKASAFARVPSLKCVGAETSTTTTHPPSTSNSIGHVENGAPVRQIIESTRAALTPKHADDTARQACERITKETKPGDPPMATIEVKSKKGRRRGTFIKDVSHFPDHLPRRADSFDEVFTGRSDQYNH